MVYPEDFEKRLGFWSIRQDLVGKCTINSSIIMVEKMHLLTDYDFLYKTIRETEEMRQAMIFDSSFHLPERADCRSVQKIGNDGQYLSIEECCKLAISLECIFELKRFLEVEEHYQSYPLLSQTVSILDIPIDVLTGIYRIIDCTTATIRDNASSRLYEIRRAIISKSKQISSRLQQVLSSAKSSGYADENAEISIHDGHAVIPVHASSKRKIQGFIMGDSATGKTSFIEPIEVVELHNAIKDLESEEKEEIIHILTDFTASISQYKDVLKDLQRVIGKIDFIAAKASLAIEMDANIVILEKEPIIHLREARHPLLEKNLKKENKAIVPLTLDLNPTKRILLVSGPNAGGKSVCLKTVGLLQYMFQCGLLIPALQNSELGIFTNIFLDIGDQQSIDNDLSTYSSHLKNMKTLLKAADSSTLFLIDEFGSGTEPTVGGAIAEAVLEKLVESKAYGVVTTHYANLKHYAMSAEGIDNGAMTFDQNRIAPLYRLVQGEPGSSFAFEIAHNIGLPQGVIDKAKSKIAPEHIQLEKLLREAARDKRYWEKKRDKIRIEDKRLENLQTDLKEKEEALQSKKNEILGNARREAQQIVEDAGSLIEKTIREIKESKADKERTRMARKELDKVKASLQPTKKMPVPAKDSVSFRPGDIVTMDDSEIPGDILQISGNKAMVRFGAIISQVALGRLKPSNKQVIKPLHSCSTFDTLNRKANFKDQIDVRGYRTVDALEEVRKLIDNALMFSIPEVRILHGKGEGILKEQIRSYLLSEGIARSIHDEKEDLGGAGITVVEF